MVSQVRPCVKRGSGFMRIGVLHPVAAAADRMMP
jgi:hypothetical protein